MAFDFDRHWRLVAGGSALAGIAVVLALHVSAKSAVEQAPVEASAPDIQPSAEPLPPLPPILAQAEACLTRCTSEGLTWPKYAGAKLPYKFADAIKKPALRTAFEELVARWPQEYAGLARLLEDDRADLPFEGSTATFLTTQSGRTVQIYFDVGYPAKQWINWQENRRPAGLLTVAVDVVSGEMAGVFNGPDTLSDYRFSGSEELLGTIIAYDVADDFLSEKLQELHYPENGPKLIFPQTADDLGKAMERLRYLGDYYRNGLITGTKTVGEFKEEEAEAKGLYWYTPNSSFTECNRNSGPASFISSYEGHPDEVTTNDIRDEQGNLVKVEVVVPQGGGMEGVTTFYKSKERCLSEQVNRNRDLADRYRGM